MSNKNKNKESKKNKKGNFGGYHWTVDKKGLNTTLASILNIEVADETEIVPTEMTKKLWDWARAKKYAPMKAIPKSDTLEEYWDNFEFKELEREKFEKLAHAAGADKLIKKEIHEIFKLQKEEPEEFEEELTEIYNKIKKSKKE